MLMDDHLASGHGAAPFGWLDLQDQVVKGDRIIPVNGSFELPREDQVQVPAHRRAKIAQKSATFRGSSHN
jgi:hypothetical protein